MTSPALMTDGFIFDADLPVGDRTQGASDVGELLRHSRMTDATRVTRQITATLTGKFVLMPYLRDVAAGTRTRYPGDGMKPLVIFVVGVVMGGAAVFVALRVHGAPPGAVPLMAKAASPASSISPNVLATPPERASSAIAARDPVPGNSVAAIARMLDSGSDAERDTALSRIAAFPAATRPPELLDALLRELDREDARIQMLEATHQEGGGEAEGEFLGDVLGLVCQHTNDPRVIPHLVPFVGTGNMVMGALENFGEQSLPGVADIASSSTRSAYVVSSALMLLDRLLERSPAAPLSEASRSRILQIAESRLSGKQEPTVAFTTIDLAVDTRDPVLRERVRKISVDPVAASSELLDSASTRSLQERAVSALNRFPQQANSP